MEANEHRKLAEVEDSMWYFRSLHGHILREGSKAVAPAPNSEGEPRCIDPLGVLRLSALPEMSAVRSFGATVMLLSSGH